MAEAAGQCQGGQRTNRKTIPKLEAQLEMLPPPTTMRVVLQSTQRWQTERLAPIQGDFVSGSVTADWTEIDAVVTVEKDRRDAGMPHQSKRLEQQQEETYESAPGRDGRCSMFMKGGWSGSDGDYISQAWEINVFPSLIRAAEEPLLRIPGMRLVE
ncbi:MAG: hypothetical protein L6R38_009560 [Xanthoria sp. 2 TBL-2021]|nr:MAG: hypothetical protein L6R38_009560 [Xanthoria sp. 2 TBL-2021]